MKDSQPAQDSVVAESAGVSRREFAQTAAAAATAFMIVPRHVLGRGIPGAERHRSTSRPSASTAWAAATPQQVMSQNIVAICDCDFGLLDNRLEALAGPRDPPPPRRPARRRGGGGGGGGRQRRRRGRRPAQPTWQNFGTSKAQHAANAKWTPTTGDANASSASSTSSCRSCRSIATTARCSTSRRTSTRSSSRRPITCTR